MLRLFSFKNMNNECCYIQQEYHEDYIDTTRVINSDSPHAGCNENTLSFASGKFSITKKIILIYF